MNEDGLTEAAFRELFSATYSQLVAYTRRRLFDISDVDDVVSEVYATAWRRRESRDLDAPALPWLYGIAANVLRNQWRADGRRLQLVERLEAQPAEEHASISDPAESQREEIRTALKRLSFDDQEILRLVAWEGLGHAEIGQALGCSTNAVGIRLHRARQRLESGLAERQAQLEPTERPEHTERPERAEGTTP